MFRTDTNDHNKLFSVIRDHPPAVSYDGLSILAVAYAHFGMWDHLDKTLNDMVTLHKV